MPQGRPGQDGQWSWKGRWELEEDAPDLLYGWRRGSGDRLKSKFQNVMVQRLSFPEFEKLIVEKPLSWQKKSQSISGNFVA